MKQALKELVQINHYYTRAINLVRDADSEATITAYIPTTRALHTLRQVAETFSQSEVPRAWALIGPYGSGKSLLAVFLSHVMGDSQKPASKEAVGILSKADETVGELYRNHIKGKAGCCRVLLNGTPAPLGKRLLIALHEGAKNFWGKSPHPIVKVLEQAAQAEEYMLDEIVEHIAQLQKAVAEANGLGVYIAIDELGKFLEYQAGHPHVNDIHLLQLIAEHSHKFKPVPLYLVVLLHQAFEQYARGLGKKLQDEWLKIQGRFGSIAFLEAAEQTLRIVRSAFTLNFNVSDYPKIKLFAKQTAETLHAAGALPGYLEADAAAELFCGCYPLHPLALLVLPHLCQKVAQNERTLFSYLGSREQHGFQESIANLCMGEWLNPAEIYDYFLLNQPTAVADSFTHHHWMEVITALERLGDNAEPQHVQLIKIIGLLNIIGSHGGLKASSTVLGLCLNNTIQQTENLEFLQQQSCITFRKFNQEYRVWQGTDFDLNAALREETNRLGHIPLAETLNERQVLSPLIARRHTIETGSLRYFVPLFLDAASAHNFQPDTQQLQVFFYLAASEEEYSQFRKISKQATELQILVFCPRMERLYDTVTEVMGLFNLAKHHAALHQDRVAQREYKVWLNNAEFTEQQLLGSFMEQPQNYHWHWRGKALNIRNKRHLQNCLSDICDELYASTPILRNELVNRDQISSSASTGRNKLFAAMLEQSEVENLGIEKFPAEKSMYLALLREPGLHRQGQNGQWFFSQPDPSHDPFCFHPVWEAIDDFLISQERQAQPLLKLYEQLRKPPYGLKNGILPVFFIAYYLVNQREIALYEDEVFCPTQTYEHLELLSKRPERYSIERFRIQGMRLEVFRRYLQTILGRIPEDATLLDIIRPLAKFIHGLPLYTQKTPNLSPETLAVRATFEKAKSPAQLLFVDLPRACNFEPFNLTEVDEALAERYMQALIGCLRELKGAYHALLENLQTQVGLALRVSNPQDLGAMRNEVQQRFMGLEKYTGGERQDLFAFIRRLSSQKSDDQAWLESVSTLLGRIPPSKWQNEHRQEADIKLAELGERLHDLASLDQAVKERPTAQSRTVLIRTISQDKGECPGKIVYIAPDQEALVKKNALAIQEVLKNLDANLGLAVIAEWLDNVGTTK